MSKKKQKLSTPSQYVLSGLVVLVLAIAGGWFGAGLRGGGGTGGGEAEPGAFIAAIQERGELRVGVAVAPPMTAEQADGTLGGPNLIPLQNLADTLGVELTPVSADWNNLVAGLQAGRYDAAAYLDATIERSLSITFSDPVYTYQGVFAVAADSEFASGEDLLDGTVAISQGTSYTSALETAGYSLTEVDKIPNAIATIKAGRADAAFADLPAILGAVQADETLKIVVPNPVIYQMASGYGLPSDIDQHSLEVINVAIANAQNSGELQAGLDEVGLLEADNLGDYEKQ